MNREEWLTRVGEGLERLFAQHGFRVRNKYRVTCGWPCCKATSARGRRVGECHPPERNADKVSQVFISPVLDEVKLIRERPNDFVKRTGEEGTGNSCANSVAGVSARTVGWEPTCTCHGKLVKRKGTRLGYGDYNLGEDTRTTDQSSSVSQASGQNRELKEFETTIVEYVSDLPLDQHPVQPCVVCDPFCGSGTTNCVALAHGQRSIGIDLSLDYIKANAIPRIEGELIKRGKASLAARPIKRVDIGEAAE